MTDDFDTYDDHELFSCPHCSGFGSVECHCGGDLCVCDNYGEEMCPVCFGEGEITEDRYDRYEESRRKHFAALAHLFPKDEK